MPRPTYENEQSIAAERAFIERLQRRWRCVFRKLPVKYELDYVAERDGVAVAYVELKVRTCNKRAYNEYMIALSKFVRAGLLSGATKLPCFLCVQWADATGYVDMMKAQGVQFGVGGRKDRGDWQDIEPVALIPIDQFKDINHG